MKPEPTSPREGRKEAVCTRSGDIPAFLAGELDAPEQTALEAHLAGCPACARTLEQTRNTLQTLKRLEPAAVTRDLAPELLDRLDSERTTNARRIHLFRPAYAAAAALLLLAGGAIGVWTLHRQNPAGSAQSLAQAPTASAHNEAVAWLCRTQEPDGSWKAEKLGGDQRFGVALSSLAMLAVLGSEPFSQEQAETVRKAVGYLVKQQDAAGEFGPSFDNAAYNQGITTLALLRAFRVLHDENLRAPIGRAIAAICRRQSPAGGWGYWGATTQEPNLSVTLWQVEALKLANRLGWSETLPGVQRAVRWVANVADDRGFFGYRRAEDFPAGTQTLTAMGMLAVLNAPDKTISPGRLEMIRAKVREATTGSDGKMDYYRTYFLTAAIKELRDEASSDQLATIRGSLVSCQVARGAQRGSWTPDDQWSLAGGRVYATAMASLSLE